MALHWVDGPTGDELPPVWRVIVAVAVATLVAAALG